MYRLMTRATASLALLFLLGACYLTTETVIPAGQGREVPGLAGEWLAADGSSDEVVNIAAVSGGYDYAMTSDSPDAMGEVLLMRSVPLSDGIWLTQMWSQNEPDDGTIMLFTSVTADTISIHVQGDVHRDLAASLGVQLMDDDIELQGNTSAILAFL